MKQYTTPDQTAKLIELGFEKPKSSVECELPKGDWRIGQVGIRKAYSIGELLSFLPKSIKANDLFFTLCVYPSSGYWVVEYDDMAFGVQARLCKDELIDALYDMCAKLKEEGGI